MKFSSSTQKGFTLVEMIVSLAIFTIVALVAVGALLKITDANKKAQSLKTAINNLNFALESMSREMRVGEVYHCEAGVVPNSNQPISNLQALSRKPCDTQQYGNWLVAFRSSEKKARVNGTGQCSLIHAYWNTTIDGTDDGTYTIKKATQKSCEQTEFVKGDFQQLLSPDVVITESRFNILNEIDHPAKAFFWLKGFAGTRDRDKTEFEIQTTVSERS